MHRECFFAKMESGQRGIWTDHPIFCFSKCVWVLAVCMESHALVIIHGDFNLESAKKNKYITK